MQESSAASDAMIEGETRRFQVSAQANWNGTWDHPLTNLDPYIVDFNLNRQLNGSVARSVTLIEGSVSALVNLTISGEYNGMNMPQVFSPYYPFSPFYHEHIIGSSINVQIIVLNSEGEESFPQFRGVVRSISVSSDARSVYLECLDYVESAMRTPVSFPPWAVSQYWVSRGYWLAQLCDSQAVIDHCLRLCDISQTPWRPTYRRELGVPFYTSDGVQFWLNGSGSMVPTVGWVDNAVAQSFPHTEVTGREMYSYNDGSPWDWSLIHADGPRPICLNEVPEETGDPATDGALLKYWVLSRDLIYGRGTHYLGFTFITRGSTAHRTVTYRQLLAVRVGQQWEIRVICHQGQMYTELANLADGNTWFSTYLTIDDENYDEHLVSVQWDTTDITGVRSWIAIGDHFNEYVSTLGWESHSGVTNGATDDLQGLVKVMHYLKMQDVGYAFRNLYGADYDDMQNLRRPAFYSAVLDRGNNRATFTPQDVNGSDAWAIIQQAAAAEWASVLWDEWGSFLFWNYETMLEKQRDIVRAISTDDINSLRLIRSLDNIRNVFNVKTQREVSIADTVYEASGVDEFLIPANSSRDFRLWDQSIQYISPFDPPRYTTIPNQSYTSFPQWSDDVQSGYVVQWLQNGQWSEDNSFVDPPLFNLFFDRYGAVVIRVYNGYNVDCRLARDGDIAAARFFGTEIIRYDPQIFKHRIEDSVQEYGERNLKIQGTWVQDGFQSRRMVERLGQRTAYPVPMTDNIEIPGDPRLQLGDTIELHDPEGLGPNLPVQIFGIDHSINVDGGFTTNLTVELTESAKYWNLGKHYYSMLGRTTTLGYGVYAYNENPSFEAGIMGYNPYQSTLIHTSENAYDGYHSMKVVANQDLDYGFRSDPVEIRGGDWYKALFHIYTTNIQEFFFAWIVWLDYKGDVVVSNLTQRSVTPQQWVELEEHAQAPLNAASAKLWLYKNGRSGTAGEFFYVDNTILTDG